MKPQVVQQVRRWYWQRITAMIMTLFVLVHLVLMIHAIKGGLSAGEILARTQGSVLWVLFYGLFVVLVSVHASIGLGNILVEWARLPQGSARLISNLVALALLVLGLRAVWAVTCGSMP